MLNHERGDRGEWWERRAIEASAKALTSVNRALASVDRALASDRAEAVVSRPTKVGRKTRRTANKSAVRNRRAITAKAKARVLGGKSTKKVSPADVIRAETTRVSALRRANARKSA